LQRLEKHDQLLDLEKECYKKHIFSILKIIGRAKTGISYSSLRRDYLGKGKELRFSNTYLAAYLHWLKEEEYVTKGRRKKRLSEKGEKGLIALEDFLYSPGASLKISWNLPIKKELQADLKGKVDVYTKTAIFSKDYIQNKIIELSAALSFASEDIYLEIKIQPIEPGKILGLLKLLWNFYWLKTNQSGNSSNIFGPLYIKLPLRGEKNEDVYTEFWKKHLDTFLKFKGIKFNGYTTIDGQKITDEERPLYSPLPRELEALLKVQLEDQETKKWVESQLEKDADWFMPHPIWVEIGFKQRRDLSVDSLNQVSPPIFHEIISPELPQEYGAFDNIFRFVVQKNDPKSVQALYFWILEDSKWKRPDFFKSWRIIRNEFKEKIDEDQKLRNLARILD